MVESSKYHPFPPPAFSHPFQRQETEIEVHNVPFSGMMEALIAGVVEENAARGRDAIVNAARRIRARASTLGRVSRKRRKASS